MEYIKIKNADKIVKDSPYVVNNPSVYKNKWHKEAFKNNNPIYLELGMGRGDFIIDMAKTYPNINFIGLEVNDSQMVNAINRDANEVANIFGKEIDTIYLTFCDPWPKKIDERRRFTHESFLKLYDRIFKKNKHIIMKTDNSDVFPLTTLKSSRG